MDLEIVHEFAIILSRVIGFCSIFNIHLYTHYDREFYSRIFSLSVKDLGFILMNVIRDLSIEQFLVIYQMFLCSCDLGVLLAGDILVVRGYRNYFLLEGFFQHYERIGKTQCLLLSDSA